MLDEPLGSLDRALRERLMNELRHILKSVRVTTLYVTHDQSEAFAVGDRVAVMQSGRIEQVDAPETVHRQPASPFVARFLGMSNLLPGVILDPAAGRVETAVGELQTEYSLPDRPTIEPQEITVLLRPRAAQPVNETGQGINIVQGTVQERSFRGAYYRLVIHHDSDTELIFELDPSEDNIPSVGDRVTLSIRPGGINLLGQEGV
jgi:ABC-type Fe3+/spermidine/putrescine transport system ATPase subunit